MIRSKNYAPNHLISNLESGFTIALTAPFLIDQNELIGYAVSPEEGYCANIPIDEFISICDSTYFQVNTPRIFHGLKRIWEFIDDRGSHRDRHEAASINNLRDNQSLAREKLRKSDHNFPGNFRGAFSSRDTRTAGHPGAGPFKLGRKAEKSCLIAEPACKVGSYWKPVLVPEKRY